MTELSKNFEPKQIQDKWYSFWLKKGYFHSESDNNADNAYTIVMPPPNVTGVLHMGHALNNTIQDILIRRARMQGKNACWVPGTDHASIATEAKVVGMLREKGIAKSSLSREKFLDYAWEWKEKYGGIILDQLKKLGCSLDWSRTTFTMDSDYYQSVIKVFVDLYNKKLIYRGKRMINWDVKAKTALSDEEVIFKEVQSKLYFLNYKLDEVEGYITIATVRPETILGDTAIFVNPKDERYKHLIGKFAFVPLINRKIPILADEYVEMDFGTGALKVTPAHDKNDYALAQKYHLEIIDTMNDDGTMNEAAQLYIGEDRFEVRKKITKDLEATGHLLKTQDYTNQVGFSERTDVVVEQKLSMQWWVSMQPLATKALDVVMNEEIKFYPSKFKNTYKHWMENIKDWCISRQLWWGHQIPAWYMPDGSYEVAANKETAFEQFKVKGTSFAMNDMRQDEDCLDTWFSSWLWPMEVFKGISNPGNKEINYYYPTATLVTAPEIIFFWVARMIIAGLEYKQTIPFKEVYFTGIVRDKQGKKMSKSLGNSPDLLGLIDQYGADAVRFGIMIASPAGNDLLWDESSNEQGMKFNNKLWNALKLVKMWEERIAFADETATYDFAVKWFENRLSQAKAELSELYKDFKLSEALKTIYSLIWDDFCSWYLEWVKPELGQPIAKNVYDKTVDFFEALMQLLHPFMPFITEEIYQLLRKERAAEDSICISKERIPDVFLLEILAKGQILKDDITAIRDIRKKYEIKNSELLKFQGNAAADLVYRGLQPNEGLLAILSKSANVRYHVSQNNLNEVVVNSDDRSFFITIDKKIDNTIQKEQLLKDLDYEQGFLQSVLKKLTNERFVQNAKPEVVALEEKKKADATARIEAIKESLAKLN